jgi:BirA family biotin operon repressor/biotin-[acetyl-CoA-carboxylase] ligase
VLGFGVNVAVRMQDLPAELHERAGTLGRAPEEREAVLAELLAALEAALALRADPLLTRWCARDALLGREVHWTGGGAGRAAGIDASGRLVVELPDGGRTALDAGEVHLGGVGADPAAGAPRP